jgi:methionyl-tRNA synthetase
MSKSLGNIEDPMELIDTFGVDQLRYFLMREAVFGNDGNYSDELLINRVNSDLSNDLGNLSQRCLSMVNKHCNSKVPEKNSLNDIDQELLSLPEDKINKIFEMMDKFQINSYIEEVFNIISLTNKYFSDQKPWELKNNDVMRMQSVLWVTIEMIRRISIMLQPVMPDSCKRLLDLLCIKDDYRALSFISDEFSLISGKAIKEPVIIFPRIEYKK